MQLDDLDRTATAAFEGYVVRKDLVRTFSRQFPVPTYVVEFLLGRYCATTDEAEIQEGLEIVQRQLSSRTVKAGEEELFKARAREAGSVKIIDIVTARLDSKTDSYIATLPSLRLTDVRLTPEMVKDNERMLTGGFYAEVTLGYDASIAQEKGGRPFGIEALRAIQLSKREVLDVLPRAGSDSPPPNGEIFCCVASASNPRPCRNGRRAHFCSEWCRSSSATTTLSNSALGEQASRICSSKCPPTRTLSPVARLRWRVCSSTTPTASVASSVSTMSCASTRCLAFPSIRRMASTS